MVQKKNDISANQAWEILIKKYNILDEIKNKGLFFIEANKIKEFKEPRLMAKWDSSESLPSIFKKNKINILPNSRSSYIISDFKLYEPIPELGEAIIDMEHIDLPEYETIDINDIKSEANAINVLSLTGILERFLENGKNHATFNGRMGTGIFDFKVDTYSGGKIEIHVDKAQCEIDGGFENEESVIIMEAKNVVHEDFHIRQLYYPYRLWQKKVKKPIRLVFSIYSNMIYRLFEYEFKNLNDYSSIQLINEKNYSLQDTKITEDELVMLWEKTRVKYDDDQNKVSTPFIQANKMARIISLLEQLYGNSMTDLEISILMEFEKRQSGYYYNAGKYLGLFKKTNNKVQLTNLGIKVFKLNYKERQLKIVELILEHKIFNYFVGKINDSGEMPSDEEIICKMSEFNVCSQNLLSRRASSVSSWLKWIFNLTKLGK